MVIISPNIALADNLPLMPQRKSAILDHSLPGVCSLGLHPNFAHEYSH